MTQSPNDSTDKAPAEPDTPDAPWKPTECDVVWSRFDKSKAQALGLVIKIPTSEAADQGTPSVYCDVQRNDRYCVALLHNEAHVYPPQYYLTPFHQKKAEGLKCMRAKLNSLTPWDKIKRRAIKDIIAWKKKAHNLEDSHDFTKCANCCDEATDLFWERIGLTRGHAHIEQKEELDKAKKKAIEEANLREQKVKAREEKLAAAKNAEGDKGTNETQTKKESESGSDGGTNGEEDEDTDDDDDNGSEEDEDEDEEEESSSDESFSDPDEREESDGESGKPSAATAKKGAGRRGGKRRLSITSPSSGKESETETDSGGENRSKQVRKKKKAAPAAAAAIA